jgi:hypothetical protein
MNNSPRIFRLTWLTSSPLLRGNWVAIVLSFIPGILSILSLVIALGLNRGDQRVSLLSSAVALSVSMTLIQLPAYTGRVELDEETMTLVNQFSGARGRRQIPRESLHEIYFAPLNRPPKWLPFGWAIGELICAAGAVSSGCRLDGSGDGWYWLTGLALGLSIWPLITARWQAEVQVVLSYNRPGEMRPGLIRAWATPHQASSLVHTLQGKIDWKEPERVDEP